MPKKSDKAVKLTQLDGTVVVDNINWHNPVTQVSFSTDASSGSVQVKVKYHPDANFETIYEDDGVTPLEVNLTNLKSFQLINKWVHSFEFTPVSVVGSYSVHVASGSFEKTTLPN